MTPSSSAVSLRGSDKLARIPVKVDRAIASPPKPPWLRARDPGTPAVLAPQNVLREQRLHTVCEEAACPNIGECFVHGTAIFMILGALCTRRCPFCDVAHGRSLPPDPEEPAHLAATAKAMGLRYVVVTIGGPGRPAGQQRRPLRHPAPSRPWHQRGGADPRLPRPGGPGPGHPPGPASRRVQPQHGNRGAPLPGGAARRRLPRLAPAAGPHPGAPAGCTGSSVPGSWSAPENTETRTRSAWPWMPAAPRSSQRRTPCAPSPGAGTAGWPQPGEAGGAGDSHTLFPSMPATLRAAATLVEGGFEAMVYCSDDPVQAHMLEELGCAAIMPLASLIGSGMGIPNPWNLGIIIDRARVPVIVDAGVGTASDATIAMELGCDGVLMNSAIAHAGDPVRTVRAMASAVTAGREAFLAGRMPRKFYVANPGSPTTGLIG